MDSRPWLLLDVPYLSNRAFYSLGSLNYLDVRTGVAFGVLRDIVNLQQQFSTDRIAFCFDSKTSLRKESYPAYKANRVPDGGDLAKARSELKKQIRALRCDYLPSVGYANIFKATGYEADDLIASLCVSIWNPVIIVSSDKDFYQLLSPQVSIWNPQKKEMTTDESFRKEWRIEPHDWVRVKSLAGCDTDNVAGVDGVAEKTAAKYFRGELKEGSVAAKAIAAFDWKKNRPLIQLPFAGCPVPKLQRDNVTAAKWKALANRLGMKTLADTMPVLTEDVA